MADQPVTPVKKRSRRFYYMDILNIIATIAVMWLHTSELAFSIYAGLTPLGAEFGDSNCLYLGGADFLYDFGRQLI